MATSGITSATGTTLADAPVGVNPNGILGKDDFLKLLLLELKYQDPTDPMDSEKILTQTSQLATLESADNTNKSLENLAASLTASMQYSAIGAIGKVADTGSNAVVLEKGSPANFELYFPTDAQFGSVNVMDSSGNTLKAIPLDPQKAGTHSFTWNGTDNGGKPLDEGVYYVESSYTDSAGNSHKTRVGTYPIESVRFEKGVASVKLGSNYVPLDSIKEIVGG